MTAIIPIIIVLFIAAMFIYFKIVSSPLMKLDRIKKMIDNNQLDDALVQLTKILQKDQSNGRVHLYMAQAFEKKGDENTAILEYQKCLLNAGFVSDNEQMTIHGKLAELYVKSKRYNEALGEYLILTKKYPNDSFFLMQLGDIFFNLKKYGNAANYYKRSLQISEGNPIGHYNLGRMYYFTAMNNDAERHLKRCIELQPKFYDAYYYLGLLNLKFGRSNDAIRYFSNSVYSPKFKGMTYFNLGNILYSTGQWAEVEKLYLKAIANISESDILLSVKYKLASCYESMKRIDKAIVYWQEIYLINNNYEDVSKKIAMYAELNVNDKIKEYIIAKPQDFEHIVKVIIDYFNMEIVEIINYTKLYHIIAIPKSISIQSSSKRDTTLFVMLRDAEDTFDIDEMIKIKEKAQALGCSKVIIMYPGNYADDIINYASARDIILVDKKEMMKIFRKLSI